MNTYKRYTGTPEGLFTAHVTPELQQVETNYRKRIKSFYPTNHYGIVQVLDSTNRKVLKVRFLEDGTYRNVSFANLVKGKCRNHNQPRRTSYEVLTEFDDIIYKNKAGCEFRIIWRKGDKCAVRFLKTGTELECLICNARDGKVFDPFHKSVLSVGFIGSRDDLSTRFKHEYVLWHNMMNRAYSKAHKKGYYGRVFVDEKWHNFSIFLQDLPQLHNYDKWLSERHGQSDVKYNLDKDFSFFGCDTYSKENCQFIEENLNKGTTSRTRSSRKRIAEYRSRRDKNE